MFRHILVPLDGSSRAEQALPVAARLAQASEGAVVLLRVVTLPNAMVSSSTAKPGALQAIIDADYAEARNYLDRIAQENRLMGVHAETAVVVGQATASILSVAEALQSDLLVLCSHGYTGVERRILGSVAENVVHHAPLPVLLLREGGPPLVGTPPHAEGPLRALVPLDGSLRATETLIPAAQLIAALSAPGPGALHLMRVVVLPLTAPTSQREREAIIQEAMQYLSTTGEQMEGLIARLVADSKLSLTWSVTIDDDVAAGIIRVAEEGEELEDVGVSGSSDLIAMATQGYSSGQQWAIGSIPERVLLASRLPLLLVRPTNMLEKGQQTQNETVPRHDVGQRSR